MKYLTLLLLFISFHCFASNEIVAVVGDDIITSNTLNHRYNIMIKERNYQPENISPQDTKKLKMQVLQSLINERILRQEANKLQISVTDEEVRKAIKHIEKTQNIAPGTFTQEINKQGLPLEVVLDQIKNTILWEKMMGEIFVPKIEISTKEIYEFMDKFHPERVAVNFYSLETYKNNRKALSELHNNLKSCEQIKNKEIVEYAKKRITTTRINTTLKDVHDPQIQEIIISHNIKKSVVFDSGPNTLEFALLCSKEYTVTADNISHLRNLLKEKKAHLQLDQHIKKARQSKFIEIYSIE